MKYCSFASMVFGISSFRTVSSAARSCSVDIAPGPLASFDCATVLSARFLSLPVCGCDQVLRARCRVNDLRSLFLNSTSFLRL